MNTVELLRTKRRMLNGVDRLFEKINNDQDTLRFDLVLQDLKELELEISRKIQKM